MSAYPDTSFLASFYVLDSNSPTAIARMERLTPPLLITPLAELEFINALQLRLFRRELRAPAIRAAYAAYRSDLRDGILAMHSLPDTVYVRARSISERWSARLGTRFLDVVQVAAAVLLGADSFQTFDARQRRLAAAVGLKAD